VREFEAKFLEYMRSSKPEILAGIRNLGTLSEPEVLSEAISSFKKGFLGRDAEAEPGAAAGPGTAGARVQGRTKASA
jgi:hypothetical protein